MSRAWHATSIDETLAGCQSRADGLTDDEAARRLAEFGPNRLPAPPRVTVFEITSPPVAIAITGQTDPSVNLIVRNALEKQSLLVENSPPIGAWMLDQSIWRLEPNPPHERIVILPHEDGSVIDQVVVDTICAPEPASLIGLALAGTAMLRPRRRRA